MKHIIAAYTSMTDGAYFVDTIDGKDLYSLKMQDAAMFDTDLDAVITITRISTAEIKHKIIQVID